MGRVEFALKLLIFLSTCIDNFLKSLPQNKMLVLLFKDLEPHCSDHRTQGSCP